MEAGEHHPHQEAQEAVAGGEGERQPEEQRGEVQPPPAEGTVGVEEGEAKEAAPADVEGEGEGRSPRVLRPSFPQRRVKRIVTLDGEISRVNSEALHLISLSTDLFLGFLAEKAGEAALLKRKKSVRVDHLRAAARGHQPTGDFLLDCLPQPPARTVRPPEARRGPSAEKPLPPGIRRIDEFFRKPSSAAATQ